MRASTKRRLEALESDAGSSGDGLHVRRIILEPAETGPKPLPLLGWQASTLHGRYGSGITTLRQDGEDDDALWRRHDAEINEAYGRDAVVLCARLFDEEG
ncbi:hypothetical protein ACGTN6_00990 [Halomonas sp. THAF12]|uniref:hypothetical protein n=1 Tax=Halomonas sp. B23F22_10 TaxID=3459515 RepID=UPI00373E161F